MSVLNENLIIKNDFDGWYRKTFLFLSGQFVSLIGSSLVQFAIIWYITLSTKSGKYITISALCGFLPQILISLFAGVWADRYSRKKLIIFSDLLIAFFTLILAILFFLGYKELWLLFFILSIRSIGQGIQSPAVNALLPQIVPQDKLLKVNGISGTINSAMMLVSPLVSATLLTIASIESIFLIDVVTAIFAVIILFTIKVPLHNKAKKEDKVSYIADLTSGFNYTRKHKFIYSLLIFYLLFFFLLTPVAYLTPLMIARSYGEELWRLTLNEMMFFGGTILGGVIISIWGGFKNKIHTLAFSCITFGILTVSLGLSTYFIIYLIIMFISGVIVPIFNTPITALLQQKVEQDMQGRVFSLLQIVVSIAMPLGMIVFGPTADVVKIELLLIISGILITIIGVNILYTKNFKNL